MTDHRSYTHNSVVKLKPEKHPWPLRYQQFVWERTKTITAQKSFPRFHLSTSVIAVEFQAVLKKFPQVLASLISILIIIPRLEGDI